MSFKELVDDICDHGKRVTELADAGHKLETRKHTGLLEALCESMGRADAVVGAGKELDTRKGMRSQAHCIEVIGENAKFFGIYDTTLSIFAEAKLKEPKHG